MKGDLKRLRKAAKKILAHRDSLAAELKDAREEMEDLQRDAEAYRDIVYLAERYEWREARDGSLFRWLEDRLQR